MIVARLRIWSQQRLLKPDVPLHGSSITIRQFMTNTCSLPTDNEINLQNINIKLTAL